LALRPLALQKDINRERIVNLQKKINYIQVTKKKWILLVLFILLVAGWFKFFYKTWTNESVPENADCIIALDVKKITNTLIWNFITTPSQWKSGDWFSSDEEGKVSWDDMISLPDYVFLFHLSGEPENAFYTVVEINDQDDFEKGLKQYGFEKTATGSFASKQTGIEFIRNGNQLLVGNAAVENKEYLEQASAALFGKKKFTSKNYLKRVIKNTGHFSLYGPMLKYLLNPVVTHITGNFDGSSVNFSMPVYTQEFFQFAKFDFQHSDSSMLSMSFSMSYPALKQIIPDSSLQSISKAVNFNIDSLLLPSNLYYQLDISGIYPRIDSAISYTYDDNFNPVEKVVVNKVNEPAFIFTVTGKEVTTIYDYWKRNGQLEYSNDSSMFTPIPFVKSYCSIKNKNILTVASDGYKKTAQNRVIDNGIFLRILVTKIPPSLLIYLPASIQKLLKNIESIEAFDSYEGKRCILNLQFNKKKNDQPLISF